MFKVILKDCYLVGSKEVLFCRFGHFSTSGNLLVLSKLILAMTIKSKNFIFQDRLLKNQTSKHYNFLGKNTLTYKG